MTRAPAFDPGSPADVIGALAGAASRTADENLARIRPVLERAASGPVEVDRALVSAILEAPDTDRILEQIEPAALGSIAERCSSRLEAAPGDPALRRLAWDTLDLVRRRATLRRIDPGERDEWASRILRLTERSNLTVGPLFRHRAASYGAKTLFELGSQGGLRRLSWRQVADRVEILARGLLALDPDEEPGRVAIISENCVESALVDLACLTSRIVNVVIPASSTEADVRYMLQHAKVRTVIVSGKAQLEKVLLRRDDLPELRRVVCFDGRRQYGEGILSLDDLAAAAQKVSRDLPRERGEAVGIDELATVMYTSGTTGTPKGILFSHRNIVFKRFARALAIPEIGEDDVFLCYLPLFHTFGRYLELLGCVFWGATYCFLDDPSPEGLVAGMLRHRPTVFISVPKKWIQLHEAITAQADLLQATDEQLLEATRRVTGGRLRWGLSAAGHLDSEIFRLFQRNGVELMSGFGMTEATGGITMTPPGEYKDDSLGCALPGIELRRDVDGELMIRGPYVMVGYLDPPDGQPAFEPDGWFRTGDLMEIDSRGFLRLVDRKKEIYKNIKGETIAPQRVETLFRDFESIQRVFLVGDHRPFNTVLIYPNPNYGPLDLSSLSPEELREHLGSIVVSVNLFLAPFERIVDFEVIDRDLDPEKGELTSKGTPRRKVVERNFNDTIRKLYQRTSLQVGKTKLNVPNWVLQALGLTAQEIRVDSNGISIRPTGASLTVRWRSAELTQVGACLYRHRANDTLNLGTLLSSPRLWLGNEELVDFTPLNLPSQVRPVRERARIEWAGRAAPGRLPADQQQRLQDLAASGTATLLDLHLAALGLGASGEELALSAVDALAGLVSGAESPLQELALLLLSRAATVASIDVRRRAFVALAPEEFDARFPEVLAQFLATPGNVLDGDTRASLVELDLSEAKLATFIATARETCEQPSGSQSSDRRAGSLLRFLAEYGAAHPASFRKLRAFLTRTMLFASRETVRNEATRAVDGLGKGFRQWLGPPSRIAVDPETGREYRWEDVVVFDDQIERDDRRRLLSALRDTILLREAVFLFSRATAVRLSDIPPGGVWIRLLGSRHGKSVYRITVQTRERGSYDVAVNVNHSLSADQVNEETNWLILCGDAVDRDPLVEDFGGHWPERQLWTEEFIAGETLERVMRRFAKKPEEQDRFRYLWPFLAWTTLAAYIDFWNRTGRRWEIADRGMSNVVVPTHDYHTGARIVSVSNRRPHEGLISMIRSMRDEFTGPAEAEYPMLSGLVDWTVIFSSVLEVVGEQQGVDLLRRAAEEEAHQATPDLTEAISRYADDIERRGFRPMRLFFSVQRYRRWAALSVQATSQARAATLQELYDTYGLDKLAAAYPETRARFFRDTVFRDASPALAEGLDELIAKLRRREVAVDELIETVAGIRARLDLGPDEDYFLARLSFPYLRPEDAAGFEQAERGGKHSSEMVVMLEDADGNRFRVRHAMNPKEVGRLHQLFLAAKLDVRFRPEHHFLVAINERSQIVGGIYYDIQEDGRSAHLEKIVVAEPYRKKGVADGLMKDFLNRLSASGVTTVTTGFFRPEYFYGYGFKIEKRYAGLVRSLEP